MPPLGEQDNITVLLHDAGGTDRSLTLAYVEDLIAKATAAGYTFHSMPQVSADLRARTGTVEVSTWDRVAEQAATVLFVWPRSLLEVLFGIAVVSMLGVGLFNTVLALLRRRSLRRRPAMTDRPPVAVLIAAYNEELVIARTIEHVLASQYPVEQ